MAIYKIYSDEIYSLYETMIDYLMAERKEITNEKLICAMNLNIILNSACFIEGNLENKLKSVLESIKEKYNKIDISDFEIRKPINVFINNIEKDLDRKIAQCTGIEKYDELFHILLNKSLKKEKGIAEIIEGVQVLFQLRNVIAHGKEVKAYEVNAFWTNGFEENFIGGYKKAETYLLKKNIIEKKFKDLESSNVFFSNEVADHFWQTSKKFLELVDTFIESSKRELEMPVPIRY